MSGTLYLMPNTLDFGVATAGSGTSGPPDLQQVLPLGVIRIAARLPCWVAENAKTTRAFLKRVNEVIPLSQPLQAIAIVELPRANKGTPQAPAAKLDALLAPALAGQDIGLISEAGLPAVADPGAALVQAAHALNVRIEALSGPSSLMLALAASGLNGQSFAFVGYLPVDAAARHTRIRELETLSRKAQQTQLMIETPYRNATLLAALLSALSGSTRLSVSCGLTLEQGWSRTDTVSGWKARTTEIPADTPAVFSLLA
ncbi:MAG: SAM-dependent methyltransferase [Burkholderiaceae bacterium]|nr:SAM-dependent methyltransferase [Burkholderiaceae bacterium]